MILPATPVTMANGANFEPQMISDGTSASRSRRRVGIGCDAQALDKIGAPIVQGRDADAKVHCRRTGRHGVPTVRGGGAMWRVDSVQRAYQSSQLDAEAQDAEHELWLGGLSGSA